MRNRFDHLAKQIGKRALGASGPTVAHDEISPETQHADLRHEPDPARKAERERLGLLGRIASVLCLIEVYGHAPSAEEFRACLAKHIAFWQQRARNARAQRKGRRDRRRPPAAFVEPTLWIIAAGVPKAILAELRVERGPDRGWPDGVYFFGGEVLRVGIVVASELPRDRSTLLVRLMAAGSLLAPAIEDLKALPANAHERAVTERILLNLKHALGQKPNPSREEQEFIVTMQRSWEDARTEGRDEGRIEKQADDVLTVLGVRGITVPAGARKRILTEKDPQRLERWLKRAVLATSLGDVFGEPARPQRAVVPKARNGRRPLRAAAQR